MDRMLTLELVRVTERAAIAAALVRGRGDEQLADQAAVHAMRASSTGSTCAAASSSGRGRPATRRRSSSARSSARGEGPEVDIACDPLDGHDALRQEPAELALPRSRSRGKGGLLNAPDVYMEKIAIGPGYPDGLVDLDTAAAGRDQAARRGEGRQAARHLRLHPRPPAPCAAHRGGALYRRLDPPDRRRRRRRHHPRHRSRTPPASTSISARGGAPEGVLAAAALRCIGGQMCGRLILDSDEKRQRAEAHRPSQSGARLPRRGYGVRRRALRRDRHHRRQPPRRRPLRPRQRHHPLDRDPLLDRHAALGARQAPARRGAFVRGLSGGHVHRRLCERPLPTTDIAATRLALFAPGGMRWAIGGFRAARRP